MKRQTTLAAGAGLLVAVILGIALGASREQTPASPAVLNRIADKNEDAAIDAAARMKAESQATTRAADARIEANEAANLSADGANTQVEP